jgi:hypothetical protein
MGIQKMKLTCITKLVDELKKRGAHEIEFSDETHSIKVKLIPTEELPDPAKTSKQRQSNDDDELYWSTP